MQILLAALLWSTIGPVKTLAPVAATPLALGAYASSAGCPAVHDRRRPGAAGHGLAGRGRHRQTALSCSSAASLSPATRWASSEPSSARRRRQGNCRGHGDDANRHRIAEPGARQTPPGAPLVGIHPCSSHRSGVAEPRPQRLQRPRGSRARRCRQRVVRDAHRVHRGPRGPWRRTHRRLRAPVRRRCPRPPPGVPARPDIVARHGRGALVGLHLAVLGTAAAYWLYSSGLRSTRPAVAATISLAEPASATVLGVALLPANGSARPPGCRPRACRVGPPRHDDDLSVLRPLASTSPSHGEHQGDVARPRIARILIDRAHRAGSRRGPGSCELLARHVERFGQHLGVGHGGDEVGVGRPAWQRVRVQMPGTPAPAASPRLKPMFSRQACRRLDGTDGVIGWPATARCDSSASSSSSSPTCRPA